MPAQLGLILVPLNYRLIPEDHEYIINHAGVKAVLVDYEYVPSGFEPEDATYGGRAKAWLTDEVALGGTYVQEGRGDSEYELKGADLTLAAGEGTYIKAEYAETQARQVSQAGR